MGELRVCHPGVALPRPLPLDCVLCGVLCLRTFGGYRPNKMETHLPIKRASPHDSPPDLNLRTWTVSSNFRRSATRTNRSTARDNATFAISALNDWYCHPYALNPYLCIDSLTHRGWLTARSSSFVTFLEVER